MPRATIVAELTRAYAAVGFAAVLAGCAVVQRAPAREPGRESPLNSAQASRFADSVLGLMTLDEKLGQLALSPGRGTQTGPRAPEARSSIVVSSAPVSPTFFSPIPTGTRSKSGTS